MTNTIKKIVLSYSGGLDTSIMLKWLQEHYQAEIAKTQQELKLIIDELRPAALQGRGLAHALKEYAERWQEHTGIKVETAISGERPLPLEVEQA